MIIPEQMVTTCLRQVNLDFQLSSLVLFAGTGYLTETILAKRSTSRALVNII